MSSLDRRMSGPVLVFDLDHERAAMDDPTILSRSGLLTVCQPRPEG